MSAVDAAVVYTYDGDYKYTLTIKVKYNPSKDYKYNIECLTSHYHYRSGSTKDIMNCEFQHKGEGEIPPSLETIIRIAKGLMELKSLM